MITITNPQVSVIQENGAAMEVLNSCVIIMEIKKTIATVQQQVKDIAALLKNVMDMWMLHAAGNEDQENRKHVL